MKRVDLRSLYTAVHIMPRPNFLCAINIVVCHVHTTCVGNLSVNNYYLAMITAPNMVDPWKTDGIKLVDLNAQRANLINIFTAHRTVIGSIPKAIKEQSHLNTLFHFGSQMRYQHSVYGIVAKIEILHVNATTSLINSFKEVIKFLLSRHEQRNRIIM